MKSKAFLIIGMIASFVIASALNVYSLTPMLASIRPMFLVMVLIFWVIYRSTYAVSMGGVFCGTVVRFVVWNAFGSSGVLCDAHGIYSKGYAHLRQRADFGASVGDCSGGLVCLSGHIVVFAGVGIS